MRISAERLDALTEIVNIGVGRAAGILNEILAAPVRLSVPEVRLFGPGEESGVLAVLCEHRVSAIRIGFGGSFSGAASLVFPSQSASSLVDLLTGEAGQEEDLDSVRVGTLSEIGNIVLNGVMGSVSNVLGERLEYDLPEYLEGEPSSLVRAGTVECLLLAKTRFEAAETEVAGEILVLFESGSIGRLFESIDRVLEGRPWLPMA